MGCDWPMLPKQGQWRRWHFAHRPPSEHDCDPDNTLHETAKALVVGGFNAALARDSEYIIERPCVQCGAMLPVNVSVPGNRIVTEAEVVIGTRSDLVVYSGGQPLYILEIVVTHDLEPATLTAYTGSSFPTAIKHFGSFEDLAGLESSFIADESIHWPYQDDLCSTCLCSRKEIKTLQEETKRLRAVKEEAEQRKFNRRRGIIDKALEGMRRGHSEKPLFKPWYYGKPGLFRSDPTPMYPKTQWRVFANAVLLTELGFQQTNPQKPWLFRYQIHKDVPLYADLGGSDVVPI